MSMESDFRALFSFLVIHISDSFYWILDFVEIT